MAIISKRMVGINLTRTGFGIRNKVQKLKLIRKVSFTLNRKNMASHPSRPPPPTHTHARVCFIQKLRKYFANAHLMGGVDSSIGVSTRSEVNSMPSAEPTTPLLAATSVNRSCQVTPIPDSPPPPYSDELSITMDEATTSVPSQAQPLRPGQPRVSYGKLITILQADVGCTFRQLKLR